MAEACQRGIGILRSRFRVLARVGVDATSSTETGAMQITVCPKEAA